MSQYLINDVNVVLSLKDSSHGLGGVEFLETIILLYSFDFEKRAIPAYPHLEKRKGANSILTQSQAHL